MFLTRRFSVRLLLDHFEVESSSFTTRSMAIRRPSMPFFTIATAAEGVSSERNGIGSVFFYFCDLAMISSLKPLLMRIGQLEKPSE